MVFYKLIRQIFGPGRGPAEKKVFAVKLFVRSFFYNIKLNHLRANGEKIEKPGNSKVRAVGVNNIPGNLTIQVDINKGVWFITVYVRIIT